MCRCRVNRETQNSARIRRRTGRRAGRRASPADRLAMCRFRRGRTLAVSSQRESLSARSWKRIVPTFRGARALHRGVRKSAARWGVARVWPSGFHSFVSKSLESVVAVYDKGLDWRTQEASDGSHRLWLGNFRFDEAESLLPATQAGFLACIVGCWHKIVV